MSGNYLYCQNPQCREYLGSLGGDTCQSCGWRSGETFESDPRFVISPRAQPTAAPSGHDAAQPHEGE